MLTTRRCIAAAALLICGYTAVFGLPFLWPQQDKLSVSYAFGFNNRICQIVILLLMAAFAFLLKDVDLRPADWKCEPIRRTEVILLVTTCAISVMGALVIWAITRSGAFFEATYFLDRLEMHAFGGTLYKSFEFDYGPLLYYPSLIMGRLFHLSLGDGYYLSWVFTWAVGVCALWLLFRMLPGKRQARNWMYLLIWAMWFAAVSDGGINYTPLRFVIAPLLVLWIQRLCERRVSPVRVGGAAALGVVSILLYSPEQAVIAMAGITYCFLFTGGFDSRKRIMLTSALVAWFGLWLLLIDRLHVLDSMKSMGGGSMNFPILPSFSVIYLIFLLLLSACVGFSEWRAGRKAGPVMCLAAMSLVAFPTAFGRSDPGHVMVNLFPLITATVLTLLSRTRKVGLGVALGLALVILTQLRFHTVQIFRELGRARISQVVHGDAPMTRLDRWWIQHMSHLPGAQGALAPGYVPPPLPGTPLTPGTRLLAPLGTRSRAVPYSDGLLVATGYYPWFHDKLRTDMAQQKIKEIESYGNILLLLPDPKNVYCDSPAESYRLTVHEVLHPWFIPRLKHVPDTGAPLCAYLQAHYAPMEGVQEVRRMTVYMRKTSPSFDTPAPK